MSSPIESQILSLIRQGEGLQVEFKEQAAENVCKEVAAMATTAGGHIIIGVDDGGNIVGVDNPQQARGRIEGWINAHVSPTPTIDAKIYELDGKAVVSIYVLKGHAPVYHDHHRPTHRVGTSSLPMTPTQVSDRHARIGVAAGILGQGELATMNLDDIRRLLTSPV